MNISPDILNKIKKLEDKYASMGQDMSSYLEGLLYSNSLTYWNYIHLDTLLSLQTPRTDFPDEQIFIMYHQITELYFKLILHELSQLAEQKNKGLPLWLKHIKRATNYFRNLCESFDVMVDGMDPEQFLKFRMSLLPASGFQSYQFRLIELRSTNLFQLLHNDVQSDLRPQESLDKLYEHIYWKYGNLELKSGNKTLTLRMFEEKYDAPLLRKAGKYKSFNLYALYKTLPENIRQSPELIQALKSYDLYANVFWRLSHYKSAVRYLQRDPEIIKATGGTNWQKYLPPRFQRIIYFPEIWTEEEKREWGKTWVMKLFQEKVVNQW